MFLTASLQGTSLTITNGTIVLLDAVGARLVIAGLIRVERDAVLMGAGKINALSLEVAGTLAAGASLQYACSLCSPLQTQKYGLLTVNTTGLAVITGSMAVKLSGESLSYGSAYLTAGVWVALC